MCRYGYQTYKSHFACFRCRKMFKKVALADIIRQNGDEYLWQAARYRDARRKPPDYEKRIRAFQEKYGGERIQICPDCGGEMADLGLDAKAPPRSKVAAWKALESLYSVGVSFHTCGCHGPGYIPKDKGALRVQLAEILLQYESNLRKTQATQYENSEEKSGDLNYWRERIAAVRANLRK